MVKKVLLTIAALIGAIIISFFAVITTLASIFGQQTQYYDGLKSSGQGQGIGYIIVVLALIIFGVFSYLIWRNFWKITFFIFVPIVALGTIGDATHITSWRMFDWLGDVGTVVALIALFSYSFDFTILSKKFWMAFFLFFLVFTVYALIIYIIPQKIYPIPSYLVGYNSRLNFGQPNYLTIALFVIFGIPSLYASYKLANKRTK